MLDSFAAKSEDSPEYVSILSRKPGTAFIQALLVAHESLKLHNNLCTPLATAACAHDFHVKQQEVECRGTGVLQQRDCAFEFRPSCWYECQ